MARIDGAEYQTVIRLSAIRRASPSGSLPTSSGTSTTLAPLQSGVYRSRIERSKWNGACDEKRSCAVGSNTATHHSTKLVAFSCDSMTPLGFPVEPEV